jgi:hypothetical protein
MKFIYLVRNPVDRIVSSYMHTYERGYTDADIRTAVIEDRLFIDVTRYHTQINPYIKKFGRDNVFLVDFDDFTQNREAVLRSLSEFLGIDFEGFSDFQNVHRNASVGGGKRHHKLDHPSLPMRAIRRFMPVYWKKITDNSERAFMKKIELNIEIKQMILNMLELEMNEMQKLMNKDLSKWMTIED